MGKFSIIIPVRNGGDYLKDAIQSVLAQTLIDFNLLIIESGSTDGSIEYIRSIKDNRLELYTVKESLGIESNWNRILALKRNEYMTILGQDDILHPNYLETIQDLISKHPNASLFQTHFNFINADGQLIRPCLPMDEIQYSHEFLADHLTQTLDSMGTGYMFKSKDYDALGGIPNYPDLIFADYALWIQLSAINYKATSLQNCFSYRKHKSLSSITKGNNYQQSFHLYILFIKEKTDSDLCFKLVVERYGKEMLYFYCEKISHRLLKAIKEDNRIRVADFIEQCKVYAQWLIPHQKFVPESKRRIYAALLIDNNLIAHKLFLLFNKMVK